MDDRLGRGLEHRLAHGARVEQIERDRLAPERPQTFGVARRPVGADHLVPSFDQLGTSRLPIAPLAPATKTLIVFSFLDRNSLRVELYIRMN